MSKLLTILTFVLILGSSIATSSLATAPAMKGMWFTGIDYARLDNVTKVKSELSRLQKLGFTHIYVNINPGCTVFDVKINNLNLRCTSKLYQSRNILSEFINNTTMKVIAWNEYGYLTPSSHPILSIDPKALLKTANGSTSDDKGHFWLDPHNSNVIAMQQTVNSELLRQYPKIGGIQYDDHFGYSSMMISPSIAKEYTGPKSQFDSKWTSFRASRFTNVVTDLLTFTKNINPNLEFSISPGDIGQSYKYYLQDIPKWTNLKFKNSKLINNIIIQVYRERITNFKEVVDRSATKSILRSGTPIYVGISYIANGVYLPNTLIKEQYAYAKKSGFAGVSLFHNLGFQFDSENRNSNAARDQMMKNL